MTFPNKKASRMGGFFVYKSGFTLSAVMVNEHLTQRDLCSIQHEIQLYSYSQ